MQNIIELENEYVLQVYKRASFVVERGEGIYVYDTAGNRYADWMAGIAVNALGYGDAEVLEAITAQSKKLVHITNLYHTIPHAKLAQLLVEHSFADRVFFCNSGTEAMEAALKFARKYTYVAQDEQRREFIAFTNAFHGRTFGALSITPRDKYQKPYEPLVPGTKILPFNDLKAAEREINDSTCAVVIEPVQGEGGINPANPDFLRGLRKLCDERGALLIFDEVQCGLGRTGYLWAHDYYGVKPDLMALAKPLGGGFPIGATLMKEKVARVMEVGDHGSTFAANPVICAVAEVIFRRISDEAFLQQVQCIGDYLGSQLQALQEKHDTVTAVRGRGLMWGIDLTIEAKPLIARGYERGVLLVNAGEKVLRFVPPLIVTQADVDDLIKKLDGILQDAKSE